MSVIHFYCPIAVQPKQSMRMRVVNGRPMSYQSPKVVNNAKALIAAMKPWAPSQPWDGPVSLHVIFHMAIPKSISKKKAEQLFSKGHDKKSDRGNMLKQLEDCLEAAGFVKNDSQFYTGGVSKFWSYESGVTVRLEK